MFCMAVLMVASSGRARAQPAGNEPAQGQASQSALPPLRVVVAGNAPFVVTEPSPTGLSMDVWSVVMAELGRDYTTTVVDSVPRAIELVAGGQADVAVGPISITAARAERVAFTYPYFEASLAILAPESRSLLDRVRPFLTAAFLTGLGALLAVLGIVGTLIWLAERRHNPEQFPHEPLRGIGNGIWMALVTMTTVGYGDRVPLSITGRVITGLWMLLAMIAASSLTAFVATALTLSQIAGPVISEANDLPGRAVGVVEGTTSETFAAEHRARVVRFSDLETAVNALDRDAVDAVVFDRPMLRYALRQHPALDVRLSSASYEPQGYGFAVPLEAPFRHSLDVAMLRLQESGVLETIVEKWLGPG